MNVDGWIGLERGAARTWPSVRVASIDARRLSYIRCVLAFASLAAVFIEPSDPAHFVALTYVSIAAYCAYAVAVSFLSVRLGWPLPARALHWLDVAFYIYLMCLTEGTRSIFFYCFFFPIMVASFSYGSREGLLVTLASTGAFLSVGVLATPREDFGLNQLLLRPVYLLTLGYLIAYWGECEVQLKRQLILLHAMGSFRNPRIGLAFTMADSLDRLRTLYNADFSILVMSDHEEESPLVYSSSGAAGRWDVGGALSKPARAMLLETPDQTAITYRARPKFVFWRPRFVAWDLTDRLHHRPASKASCDQAAKILKANSFVSVPYAQHDGSKGRIYVASNTNFTSQDVAFVLHFSQTLSILAENIQLVDELVSAASERERSKIALDIHDTTIQPYIGLRMGLQALYREIDDDSSIKAPLQELIAMADLTVRDLRTYAADLRRKTREVDDGLAAAVNEQAARYERFYGVKVDVDIDAVSSFGGLASDIFHIIVEGLNNIRKHTTANKAYVRVARTEMALQVEIGNEASGHHAGFIPRSIEQRAQTLGGTVCVGVKDGYTLVNVSVPI